MNGWRKSWPVLLLTVVALGTFGDNKLWPEQPPELPLDPPSPTQASSLPREFVRLARDYDIWMENKKHMLVVVDGEVVLREGMLEMFACPKGTKEHESIVAVNCKAQFVHAGLLAVGAVAGRPVQFQPQYIPASGTKIDVWVLWRDADGKKHQVRAQEWIKDARSGKAMEHPWVFAGSGFWTDPADGKRYYYGDTGDFICVSNFPSATLDLPIRSSDVNTELSFTAFTERIPPRGTKVRLVLVPQLDRKQKTQEPKPASSSVPSTTKSKPVSP